MSTTATDNLANARQQAMAQYDHIADMVSRMNTATEDGDDDGDLADQVREEIMEDALSVEVRASWHVPGVPAVPDEYRILLCTGGPAVQIVGSIGSFNAPKTATLQCQDWSTPWTDVSTNIDERVLLTYAQQFYYGE